MKIFKLVICILFGLMFINAGLNKFLMYMPMPKDLPQEITKVNEAFASIVWLMPLIAVIEIIGGLLFMIPKTRALGAIVIFPIMVGIILHHIYYAPEGIPIALVLFLINIWIIIDNRKKYTPLINT